MTPFLLRPGIRRMPGMPYLVGTHFFGWGTEKILAAINRVPRAFAECPGNAGYYYLPDGGYLFAASGHSANALGALFDGESFVMGSHFFGRGFLIRKEISYSGRGTRSFLCPVWRNEGMKIRKRKREGPSVGARFLTIREENKQF